MACLNKTPALPTNLRVFLLLSRGKTTRPQEWKDKSRFQVKIHPDQVPVEETWNSGRQKWVDVRWKNKNSAETLIHTMAMDETRRSDPHEARRISDAKLTALRSSLMAKGYVLMQYTPCAHSGHRFCRERKSYDPPDDVENVIKNAFETAVQPQSPADSWIDFKLTDLKIKFKFLLLCASRLNHQVPNSDIYLMNTVRDVVKFYKEPVRGLMTYDHLIRVQKREELPPNLYLIPDDDMYDPNNQFMDGIDAFPGNPDVRFGIRDKLKRPPTKQAIPWPDI